MVDVTRLTLSSIGVSFSEISTDVVVEVSLGMLQIEQSLPFEFQGRIEGLFGNFNGDEMDDLIFRNGTQLDRNASDSLIHEFGQSCKSLYYYCHQLLQLQPPFHYVHLLI